MCEIRADGKVVRSSSSSAAGEASPPSVICRNSGSAPRVRAELGQHEPPERRRRADVVDCVVVDQLEDGLRAPY